MPKWVAEGALQKYFVERHERYSFKGQKIISARLNRLHSCFEAALLLR
jgi:hypothetical protein